MEFRRKTKTLKGVPLGMYTVLVLLVISLFWANSSFVNLEQLEDSSLKKDSLEIVPQTVEEPEVDSLSKPEIYIPEVAVKPLEDSLTTAPAVKEEIPQEKINEKTADQKKDNLKPKKEEETKKTSEPKKTKIGTERKLTAFIPGTMGKPGKLPSSNCKTKGELVMFITIDETGKVISAGRSKGISDPCNITAAVIWLKKYVKANKKPNETSTGTYTIKF
ncbi:hypothetical protein [Soonwooa purpurea]